MMSIVQLSRDNREEFLIPSKELGTILVPMRLGVTPVPIPNTMVKTQAADDTALETMWESRWVPGSIKGLIAQPVRAHA